MGDQQERPECYCKDSQERFLNKAFERLSLREAQRRLLVHSFREISVEIPLRSPHDDDETLPSSPLSAPCARWNYAAFEW